MICESSDMTAWYAPGDPTLARAILEAIVNLFPPPSGDPNAKTQALIFDCHYDAYRGVIVHIRVMQGKIKTGDTIRMMNTKSEYKVENTGIFKIKYEDTGILEAGDILAFCHTYSMLR